MKNTKNTIGMISFWILATLATACDGSAGDSKQAEEALVLRSYKVPATHGPEIEAILRSLLQRGKDAPAVGRVEQSPDGQILVTAPASFHPGVEQFLSGLDKAPPTPPPTIRIDYWAVLGRTAAGQTATQTPAILQETVESLAKMHGPMDFEVLEMLSVTSLSGESSQAKGGAMRIGQSATVFEGNVLAKVNIETGAANELRTRIKIPEDKIVVLGQSGFVAGYAGKHDYVQKRAEAKGSPLPTLYYIIRAQIIKD